LEVGRLEALYTADDRGFAQTTARVNKSFQDTAKHAAQTERTVAQAFKAPPPHLQTSLNNVSSSFVSLKSIAAGVFAGFGVSFAVAELAQAGRAVLNFSSTLETSKIAFETLLGSAELATAHLKELEKFALTTPFEFQGLIGASKRMQAMGFEAKQVVPILTDVGNAVAAIGGNSQVLDRVILALSQMQAKGRVAAQEVNQLAEAGIPAWRILAEEMNMSRAEVIKLAENGKISAQVFLEAFQKFSRVNFGGMMERQSRTFAGAMSNIKDTLLQTSATAFQPLFEKISEITDRMSQELAAGKPDLESSFRVLLGGLVEIAGTAGGQIADALISKITDPRKWAIAQDDPFYVDRLFKGLFRNLPDVEAPFGNVTGAEIPAINVPDMRAPLQTLRAAQAQVSEGAKKAGEIVNDLALKLAFYGQNTEVAATKQRLLAIGLEALTSAEGRLAVQLAQLIDKQRISNELTEQQERFVKGLADITEGKYKNAFESLSGATSDAILNTMELARAEDGGLTALERFNFGLGSQVKGMIKNAQASGFSAEQIELLTFGLNNATDAFKNLTAAQADATRKTEIKRLGEQRQELLRSIAGVDVDLGRQIRGTPSDEIQRLAEQLEGLSLLKIRPGGLDLFVEKLRSGAMDAKASVAEIGTAISGAASDLGSELPNVTAKIQNLFLKAKTLTDLFAKEEGTQRYKETMASLLGIIQADIRLTNAQRIEKLLLTDAYKNLTEQQIESLKATASQADITERLRERRDQMREVAEDIGFIFGDVFDSIGRGWESLWDSMARTAKDIGRQIIQELFTGLASRAFNVPFESRSGGIVGLLTNSILNRNRNLPAAGTTTGGWGDFNPGFPTAPGRAMGGPVDAGKLYRINERGQEFFRPNVGGQVIPIGPQQQTQPISRLYLVDNERAAYAKGALSREIQRVNKRMRKSGKLVAV
jgi:tape measure domain-containing protein